MTQETRYFPLQGGLNLVTPAISTPPGNIIAGQNYEAVDRGYQRCGGFERFDGRPKPSESSFWVIRFDAGTTAASAGDILTGGTSGATGEVLIGSEVEAGSFETSDASGYIVLCNVDGSFEDDESLQVDGVAICVADGGAVEHGTTSDENDTLWQRSAIEAMRNHILAVPGSGHLRGVWVYAGDTYAFRDNADATACLMYKSTPSGWEVQSLGYMLLFTSGGVTDIAEGDTIEGATSGATGLVGRVIIESGKFENGDAAGRLILTSKTGIFAAETLKIGGTSDVATIAEDAQANTLQAGGRCEFVNNNFYGSSDRYRMYGCDGVSRAFEWDGEVFVPIITGMDADTPIHISIHKKQLFLAFAGGSVQHSGPGDPYAWSIVLGAGEIGIGQDITGLLSSTAGVLVILGRNLTALLYGSSVDDWQLVILSEDAGAIAGTAQSIGAPVYLDDAGLRTLSTTNAFGDFKLGTVTKNVASLFPNKRRTNVYATASVRVRAKDQYRLFWSDGTGLTVFVGRKTPECLSFDLGMTVHAACSSEDVEGNEVLFIGSEDGFVYQLDSGTSFDGNAVVAYLRLPFYHAGSPTQKKRWHKATLELDAPSGSNIRMAAEFNYADGGQPALREKDFDVGGGGGFWDAANWNEFIWDGPVEGRAFCSIAGLGENISIAILTDATYERPHTIHGLTVHYSYRGLRR